MEDKKIILGLDVSTETIGICILLDDSTEYGKIIELTHVKPKSNKKNISKVEEMFLKKKCFDEFMKQFSHIKFDRVVIEEPLLSSNNQQTVATLLRFNGMISESIYNMFNVVPEYISSYDARKYAFPDLMGFRKYNKKDEAYDSKKIISNVKNGKTVLFGSYPWNVDKKLVLQEKVNSIFPAIQWLLNSKGDLKKENFDASDACICCLGAMHKAKYGELIIDIDNIEITEDKISYNINYWGDNHPKVTYFS